MLAAVALLAAADPAADDAHLGLLDRRIAADVAKLDAAQRPLALLLAKVERLASAPAARRALDPQMRTDLAHVRALAAALAPATRNATVAIGRDIARAQAERSAIVAARTAAQAGDAARAAAHDTAATARLATLPGPVPRPGAPPQPPIPAPAYRLAATGQVLSWTGERLDTGVAARGLTLATAPGAAVRAPALGRIAYAGRFRGYGGIVILDHGHGWTTLLTGIDRVTARGGMLLPAGARLGAMPAASPRLTIELRHRGHPVDPAAMAAAR